MGLRLIGIAVVFALIVLGVAWLHENVRIRKKQPDKGD